MKIIGLTGGIASGKSSVAALLRRLGAAVVDADLIARQIVQPGEPALEEIAKTFGPEYLTAQGELDRKKMGALVFSDEDARRRLNEITHPRIAQRMSDEAEVARSQGKKVTFIEAALLFEAGWAEGLDGVWVVSVPEEVQLARLIGRDGFDEAQARARIAAQMPLSEKLARATFVIDNSGAPEETARIVQEAYQNL